jgi:hypothetical protein
LKRRLPAKTIAVFFAFNYWLGEEYDAVGRDRRPPDQPRRPANAYPRRLK